MRVIQKTALTGMGRAGNLPSLSSWVEGDPSVARTLFVLGGFFPTFSQRQAACGILIPRPGTESVPPTLDAWGLNHWTTRHSLEELSRPLK